MKFASTVASLAAALVSLSATYGSVIFSDNFSDPSYTLANWSNESGTWITNAGQYTLGASPQPFNYSTVSSQPNLSDFRLSVAFNNDYDQAVILRSDLGANNALMFVLRPSVGDAYFIVRNASNFGPSLNITSLNFPGGTSFQLNLTAVGNSFEAVVSTLATPDVPVLTVSLENNSTTAALTSGRVGVYRYGVTPGGGFSDFTVSTIPEPSAMGLALLGILGTCILWRRGYLKTVFTSKGEQAS